MREHSGAILQAKNPAVAGVHSLRFLPTKSLIIFEFYNVSKGKESRDARGQCRKGFEDLREGVLGLPLQGGNER